jgi:hypothetical protein
VYSTSTFLYGNVGISKTSCSCTHSETLFHLAKTGLTFSVYELYMFLKAVSVVQRLSLSPCGCCRNYSAFTGENRGYPGVRKFRLDMAPLWRIAARSGSQVSSLDWTSTMTPSPRSGRPLILYLPLIRSLATISRVLPRLSMAEIRSSVASRCFSNPS